MHAPQFRQPSPLIVTRKAGGMPNPQNRMPRKHVWELAKRSHDLIVDVCLPAKDLRRLINRAVGGQVIANEAILYEGAAFECKCRNRVSEALEAELNRRYAIAIKRFRGAGTEHEVHRLWQEALAAGDAAGAFWAALTHPCSHEVSQETLCQELYAHRHQQQARAQPDQARLAALLDENAVLARELAKAQAFCSLIQAEKDQLEDQRLRERAAVIGKDSTIAYLRAELAELRASVSQLDSRLRLQQRVTGLLEQHREQTTLIHALQQKLSAASATAAASMTVLTPAPSTQNSQGPSHPALVAGFSAELPLAEKHVLCVGGRGSNVTGYRGIVEQRGAYFSHHDGGLENGPHRLDTSLAAADLVICQTGCISHNAYWRVKNHCKRTGKRCVFVDNPGVSTLARELAGITTPTMDE